jgi:hypothetical protein
MLQNILQFIVVLPVLFLGLIAVVFAFVFVILSFIGYIPFLIWGRIKKGNWQDQIHKDSNGGKL